MQFPRTAIIVSLLLAHTFGAEPMLQGCECIEVSQARAFDGATVVFSGRVQRVEHATLVEVLNQKTGLRELRPPDTGDLTLVTFNVKKPWKGPVTALMKVMSVVRGTVCPGYEFQLGKDYVIYAGDPLELNPELVKPLAAGSRIFEVSRCPLRVRTDVDAETKRLDEGHHRAGR
jgi:hypothetical protein